MKTGQTADRAKSLDKYRQAVTDEPENPEAHVALASALYRHGLLNEAIRSAELAHRISPDHIDALLYAARWNRLMGRTSKSVDLYNKLTAISPKPAHLTDRIVGYNYLDNCDGAFIRDETVRSIAILAERYPETFDWKQYAEQRNRRIDQRLRIGYLSSSFRLHSEAHALLPVLRHHARDRFEIYAYSDCLNNDAITLEYRSAVDHWREARQLSHQALLERIRQDNIDLLVDPSGFAGEDRTPVFMMRAAPIQVTWLGYPNTTGIKQMDYRIADAFTDPPHSVADSLVTERLMRLPGALISYDPLRRTPGISSLPAIKHGFITFGFFGNRSKVSPATIKLWSRTLKAVPGSRLLIKSDFAPDPAFRNELLTAFAEHGVGRKRIGFMPAQASPTQHLKSYAEIDLSLDSYPYTGTITTCESLWMGVPMLTLTGSEHRSRVSGSLLHQLGLNDWIADDPDKFVQLAEQHTADLDSLSSLRARLRDIFRQSTLHDTAHFTRDMESLYTEFFQEFTNAAGRSDKRS